jgi:hypothetical protein
MRMQNGAAIREETTWQFLKKLYIELPYDPEILLLGIHPREIKTYTCIKIILESQVPVTHTCNPSFLGG